MGTQVDSDILPVFEDKTTVRRNVFELNFVAHLDALSVTTFLIKLEKNE